MQKFEASASINKIFYAAHVQVVETAMLLVSHEGRMMIPEQQRSADTDNLFSKAVEHFGVIVKLEQLAHEDGTVDLIESSRNRFIECTCAPLRQNSVIVCLYADGLFFVCFCEILLVCFQ